MKFNLSIFKQFFASTPDAIFIKDMEGRYIHVNSAYALILDRRVDEIFGRTDCDLIDRRKAALNEKTEKKVLAGQTVRTTRERFLLKNRPMTFQAVRFPIMDEDNQVRGLGCIIRDATIQKKLFDKIRSRRIKLNQPSDFLVKALEQTEDMVMITDLNRRIVSINKAGEEMLGYSRKELLGQDVESLYADPEERWALLHHVQQMGSVSNYETQLIHKNGHPLEISLTLSQLKDGDGRVIGTVGISKDISYQKSVEEKLRLSRIELLETRDYLNSILEHTGDMIITTDLNRQIVSFNKGGEEILGYSREEVLGMDVENLYADPEERWALMRHVQDMGNVANYETQLIHKDGHLVEISLTLSQLKNPQGEVIGTVGISKDISAQKAAEEKLRLSRIELLETRDYLNNVLENATDMIITTNTDGQIVSFNRGAELILGYDRREVIGRSVETLYPDSRERKLLQKRVEKEGSVSHYETRLVHKDGHLVSISLALSLLRDNQGQVIGTVGTSKDITEQKVLQQKLLESERMAAMGQSVAHLAHSIKNIVNGLKGGSYIVNTGFKNKRHELLQEGWDMVEGNISRISRLALDMLELSKDRPPEYRPTDLNALIEEIGTLMCERAADLQVELKIEPSPDLPELLLDLEAMHRLILNLVTNAIEAFADMDEDEEGARKRRVTISTALENKEAVIRITDNATGIRPEVKEKLFTQFYSTKARQGTGLGLAVTRKIVSEHGGRIKVDSIWGEGSTFTVYLPWRRKDQEK